jgi:multiple sugar transport system ATP-binding protein
MNFLDVAVEGDGDQVFMRYDGARLRTPPERRQALGRYAGRTVTLGVRPEHIIAGAGDASFSALVVATEQLGSDSYLYCELPHGQKLTIHAPGQTPVRRGERTPIGLRPDACHLFRADEEGCALPRRA